MTIDQLREAVAAIPCNSPWPITDGVTAFYRRGHAAALSAASELIAEYAKAAPGWKSRPTCGGWWVIRNRITSESRFVFYDAAVECGEDDRGWTNWQALGPLPSPPEGGGE